jgi:OmpA-OmpF porin, OOP family
MMSRNSILGCLYSAVLLVGVVNCAGERIKPVSLAANSDPSAEIMRLEDSLQQGKNNQLDIYSPKNFKKATEALNEAKRMRSDSKSPENILTKVGEGLAYFEKSQQVSQTSLTSLGQVPQIRNAALQAKVQETYPKEFAKLENRLKNISSSVEQGNTSDANKNQEELAKEYRDLQVKSIQTTHLGQANTLLQAAKKEDAEKWVPKTLNQAQNNFEQTVALIEQNPDNTAEIQTRAEQVQRQAQQTLDFTRQAKLIENRPPEYTVSQLDKLRDQLQSTEQQAMAQGSQLQNLQSVQSMDEKFKSAQAKFDPRDASVFRQGDKMIIRLKGLSFRKGKAAVPSQDFALLKKVEEVIRDFGGNSRVTVQGHTDSTGSRKANLKISEARAESVKDFLVADNVVTPEQIQSMGLADKSPIATNKTKDGRALNRRVDILIQPQA